MNFKYFLAFSASLFMPQALAPRSNTSSSVRQQIMPLQATIQPTLKPAAGQKDQHQEQFDAIWEAIKSLQDALNKTTELDMAQESDLETMQKRISNLEAIVQNLLKTQPNKNATAISSEIDQKQKDFSINPTDRASQRSQNVPTIPQKPTPAAALPQETTSTNYQEWITALWPYLPDELKRLPQTPEEAQAAALKLKSLLATAMTAAQSTVQQSSQTPSNQINGQNLEAIAQSVPPTTNPQAMPPHPDFDKQLPASVSPAPQNRQPEPESNPQEPGPGLASYSWPEPYNLTTEG